MNNAKFLSVYQVFYYCLFIVVISGLQSCKVYQDPISLNDASNISSTGVFKVTMTNGDEYIYDKIELKTNNYIGINKTPKEIIETPLISSEIKSIQLQNKKSSSFSNILGFGVGIGSVVLAVLMFGN